MSAAIAAGPNMQVTRRAWTELDRTALQMREIGRRIWIAHLDTLTDAQLRNCATAYRRWQRWTCFGIWQIGWPPLQTTFALRPRGSVRHGCPAGGFA